MQTAPIVQKFSIVDVSELFLTRQQTFQTILLSTALKVTTSIPAATRKKMGVVSGELEALMAMSGKSSRGMPSPPSSEEEEDSEQGTKQDHIISSASTDNHG